MVEWRDYIVTNPEVLVGKPIVKGTRLSVEFILRLLAEGWTKQEILDNYPTLTPQGLGAVLAFAAECLKEEGLFQLKKTAI